MRLVLACVNVLLALTLLLWPILCLVTVFLFDAPGSDHNPITMALALAMLGYPAPILVGNVGFWRRFKQPGQSSLFKYTAIGLAGPAVLLFLVGALEVFCKGKFACH